MIEGVVLSASSATCSNCRLTDCNSTTYTTSITERSTTIGRLCSVTGLTFYGRLTAA